MAEGRNSASSGRKSHPISRLDIKAKQFSLLALEEAMGGARAYVRGQIDDLPAVSQRYRN